MVNWSKAIDVDLTVGTLTGNGRLLTEGSD